MHNMQKSHGPLELPEDAKEKSHLEIIHAHAKNANAMQRNPMPHHARQTAQLAPGR